MTELEKRIVACNDTWLFEQIIPQEESSIVNIRATSNNEEWNLTYDIDNQTLIADDGYNHVYKGQEVINKFGITFDFDHLDYKNIVKPRKTISTITEYFKGKYDTWDNGNGISVILTEPLLSYTDYNNYALNLLLKHVGFIYSKNPLQIYVDTENFTFVIGDKTLNILQKDYSYGILLNVLGKFVVYDPDNDTIALIKGDNIKRFSCRKDKSIYDFVDKLNILFENYPIDKIWELVKFDFDGNVVIENGKISLSNIIAIQILLDRLINNNGLINQIKEKYGENTRIILKNDMLSINGQVISLNKMPTIEEIQNDIVDIKELNNILESKLH